MDDMARAKEEQEKEEELKAANPPAPNPVIE